MSMSTLKWRQIPSAISSLVAALLEVFKVFTNLFAYDRDDDKRCWRAALYCEAVVNMPLASMLAALYMCNDVHARVRMRHVCRVSVVPCTPTSFVAQRIGR
jgi:hypothetical protein